MHKNVGSMKNIWKHIGVFDVHVWCNKKGKLAKVKGEKKTKKMEILMKVASRSIDQFKRGQKNT
jgi:hypothetical protein